MKSFFTQIFYLLLFSVSSQAQVCTANIQLSTQTDVDNFQANYNCSTIDGNMIIQSAGVPAITNLDGLAGLESILGTLQITVNTSLTDIDGLSNLHTVGGNLIMGFNPLIDNVDGFTGLTTLGQNLVISLNHNLSNIDGFISLQDVYGNLEVTVNATLQNVNGLSNIQFVGQNLTISQNEQVTNINGLSGVTLIGQQLSVTYNPLLNNIEGLANIASVGANLVILENQLLEECCSVYGLLNGSNTAGVITVSNNQTGCSSPAEIISCPVDADNDGFNNLVDCDDLNPAIYPGAEEICDGFDNDCDGIIPSDELDTDLDGFSACEGDFDDSENSIYPGAPELCDGLDNNCDGVIPTDELDQDADGYSVCEGDYNDNNMTIYPGAPELCDGLDNDCDGQVPGDEIDEDGDGFYACEGDCDDTNMDVYPGAPELCDEIDNNCDGNIDEGIDCTPASNAIVCDAYAISTAYEWIRKVKMGEVNNHSGDNGGYADFTDQSISVSKGHYTKIWLKPGFSCHKYKEHWRVWIDWNQDGDFEDDGEKVVQKKTSKNFKKYIGVPTDAATGSTTMRISMKYGSYADPCEIYDEGEVEDYTIEVLPPGSGMVVQDDLFTFETDKSSTKTDLNWDISDDADIEYYEVETSKDGVNFEVIEIVESVQSEYGRSYSSVDFNPAPGDNYYRIRVVDQDGDYYYSQIESEVFDVDINELIVYPNPTDGVLHMSMKDFAGKTATIIIYDQQGQEKASRVLEVIPNGPISFDVSSFGSGNYSLSVQVDNLKRMHKQFVVIKR